MTQTLRVVLVTALMLLVPLTQASHAMPIGASTGRVRHIAQLAQTPERRICPDRRQGKQKGRISDPDGRVAQSVIHPTNDVVLRQILRIFNDPGLQLAASDVFCHISEYFLTWFADLEAYGNVECFSLVSLIETIVDVIEPTPCKVIDQAFGSGGMFVQLAHFVGSTNATPYERLNVYGMEKPLNQPVGQDELRRSRSGG
ncbi:MAG: N-6 DNA methylase [Candidatus Saccharibacteria bacterium]|nr:N-6 DNA methylase [Pseudorhodobacter sp.]